MLAVRNQNLRDTWIKINIGLQALFLHSLP